MNDHARFAIPGRLAFEAGAGGLTRAVLSHQGSVARVYLLGAHVADWEPAGQQPVLWTSAKSCFEAGKPIRGGIPLCWPWFGPAAVQGQPGHGCARFLDWTPQESCVLHDGSVRLILGLADSAASRPYTPARFGLSLALTLGAGLDVALETANTGSEAFSHDAALHTYFRVGDVRQARVSGLDACPYLDKVGQPARRVQSGDIAFSGETDRVYIPSTATTEIIDPVLKRRIRIAKSGSQATVVWNPWIAKAKAMPDFGDEEWPDMLCVETANCLEARSHLAPGLRQRIAASYTVAAL